MNKSLHSLPLFVSLCLLVSAASGFSATFPGNAVITIPDPSGSLSWNSGAGAMLVQCWFKLSVPSGTALANNMTILVNGTSGSESTFAYLVRFNITSGNVEFVTQGSSGVTNIILIQQPYLERWYHLAIARQQNQFSTYVDGRFVSSVTAAVGDTSNSAGVSVGGWGNGQYLYGEVQEVSIYQSVPAELQYFVVQYMFADQPTNDPSLNLTGYYKLAYSANSGDNLANFAPGAQSPAGTIQGSGVTFPQTDQGGEQSAFDAQKDGGRNAVIPLSGAFSWNQTALSRPTPGIAFALQFGYSSANVSAGSDLGGINPYAGGVLGNGWRHSFQMQVLPAQAFSPLADTSTIGLMNWDGSIETWDFAGYVNNDETFQTRDGEYHGELVLTISNCQWTTPDRLVYIFARPDFGPPLMRGNLLQIHDFNGNSVQVLYNQTTGVVTQVVDSVGGLYTFNYHAGLLTNVTFNAWSLNFAYDATNRLISKSITNTSGLYSNVSNTWQFAYGTNGLLKQIIDPRGITNTFVQYDQYGRMTNQMDALDRTTATLYDTPASRQLTQIDPATNSWVETLDRKGNVLSQSDPLGNTTSYTYDANDNRTSVTEPLGWTTFFGYDSRANVIAKTNALGELTTWVMHPFFNKPIQQITPQPADVGGSTTWTNFYSFDSGGNLTNHSDAVGTLVSYTYSTNALVLASTDANGHTTSFGYDTNGFLISRTDPSTNTTFYTRNDVGWNLKETDALGDPTSYTYDLNGKPTRIQDVLGRIFTRAYDADGNLLSQSDGKVQLTVFAYDAANQKTNMTDRTGTNKWNYFYTSRGKLDHVTDPLGNSVSNAYDAANRLTSIMDPLGHSVSNQYDANGKLIVCFDKLGARWIKTWDRLNRVVAETDPLGNTRTTSYDVADRVQQITSPNGYPSAHVYDGRGRLTKWVDAQNSLWLYAYDGVGSITNITDALGGHYVMSYGSRNERLLEQNQDGFKWQYAYDALLRVQQQTDPNGVVRTPTYDTAGRVLFVDFSTGRHDSYNYDSNDNPVTISRRVSSVSTDTQFIYDALDRVVEQDDALGQTVLYSHDPLGRVTTITYPGGKVLSNGYDALGRLTNQTDWASHQTSYAYDAADRLISRVYPNGVVQSDSFDTAGRIAGLSYAPTTITSNSVNIALSYAYDRNGNKTGSSESGTFNWPLPSLTDDQSSFTPAGRLINRQITESSPSNFVNAISYRYDPSGNMTNATGDGQSWTLAYDEDNRTTSILWDAGITSKFITDRYDALGRRISKTVDGMTTGYVLNLNGGMERVLCDLDGNGTVTAWYVHGPDLCYKVDTTNGLICYHADAQANIIALTDGNTNLVAQYAYTSYGRNLGSTNFQSQISNPYLFVGSQGVQEESDIPNLYFMRARYYSADAGVFLSTDPVKHIGAGWQPIAYVYGNGSPTRFVDPSGTDPTFVFDTADIIYKSWKGQASPLEIAAYGVGAVGTIAAVGVVAVGGAPVWATVTIAGLGVVATAQTYKGYLDEWNSDTGIVGGMLKPDVTMIGGLIQSSFASIGQSQRNLTTLSSPTAGTTPMAMLPTQNQTIANRTAASIIQPSILNNTQATTPHSPSGGNASTSSSGGGSTTYTVRAGDTLGNIGSQFGSTATAIGAANGIQNLNLIHPGQVLTIPH